MVIFMAAFMRLYFRAKLFICAHAKLYFSRETRGRVERQLGLITHGRVTQHRDAPFNFCFPFFVASSRKRGKCQGSLCDDKS
jgi:hypothetical protein